MKVQPALLNLNVDITPLVRLIGKRKWDKAFKGLCEVAEQRADKDSVDKIYSELPKVVLEVSDRQRRGYTKPNGTLEDSVGAEFMERIAQYKQERFDFYLKSMLQLIEAELKSSTK